MTRSIIENEGARQNALRNLNLLDTAPSESFDRITRMASRLLRAPVSTISLTDHDRQWFKSMVGADLSEIPRSEAPCNYAIQGDEIFVVSDMQADARFSGSILANAGIRFYAGAPLITRSGYGLGTLCVLDNKPREINAEERQLLLDLAAMVMTQIELQNTIGRIDPTSGHPNEYQLFEDLEDYGRRHPEHERTGILIELVSQEQISHGTRVLGAAYTEELVRSSTEIIRKTGGNELPLYHVGRARCLIFLDGEAGANWEELTGRLDISLREPVICSGIPVAPDPVFGVYRFKGGAENSRDVLRRLFNAMDDARKAARHVASYNEIGDRAYARSFTLLSDMLRALESPRQFLLLYQPMVDLKSGRCIGAEALLRWRHPVLGEIMPLEFIPLAEGTALIRPVTDWVLNAAISQIAAWQTDRHISKLSVNVSARNLDEGDLPSRIASLLARYRVDARHLQLEFTESALLSYGLHTLTQLAALEEMGLSIVIDDFGTGYSSLSYLQKIPASILKIDQSFIKSLSTSIHDQKLVRAVILMAHDLGYRVTAEGIEDRATFDLLASWGCDEAQGFYIARPLTASAMTAWLETRSITA